MIAFSKLALAAAIYWPDARSALAEFARVLGAHGRLVLCFTSKDSLQQKNFARHGLTLYTAGEVQQLLQAAGLQAIGATSHTDRHRKFWCVPARNTIEGEA